jgi:hypothetical protein
MPRKARADVPGHAVVAEVGQRVAQGGQLPVQHGNHARLGGVEHQVVQAEVAVHDGHAAFVARWPACGRAAIHQLVHLGDGLGDGGHVLLAPAADLALEVVAALAVVARPCGKLHAVQRRDHAVHLVVDGGALGRRHAGQGLVPQHAAFHELHDVEGAADDGFVLAQRIHVRHGHVGAGQAAHHANSRSMAWAEGSSLATGPGLARIT